MSRYNRLTLRQIIKSANKHKVDIGEEKATYMNGVLFGYFNMLNRECQNCKHFKASEHIDQNMHFGDCYHESDMINGTVTIDFGCNNFEWREDV